MSPVTFRKAERSNIGLLLMLAGGTGSGKSWSAMALAKGMSSGKRFAYCDTERGRASMYADTFDFDVFELDAPFSPDRYLAVVEAAEEKGYEVLVIDSMSHEWEGPGGLLDWHEQLMGGQESKNLSAWIKPKMSHRHFVNRLLQAKPHIVMCFRAAERVETSRDEKGKLQVVPKRSLTGLAGWLPITEKNLPFEATASFMLMAERPGCPLPIKLPDPLKLLVPLDRPIDERTGAALAAWASGESTEPADKSEAPKLTTELLDLAAQLGKRDEVATAIANNRRDHATAMPTHVKWLRAQIENARAKLSESANADVAL